MGYACPVCETPQRDGKHLAHHLAFTAMLHGDDHEEWLDEHVSDWFDREPEELATEVSPHAEDAEYHEVFEDTVDRGRPNVDVGANAGHDHDHGDHQHGRDSPARSSVVDETGPTDPKTAEALQEAREMTREMRDDGAEGAEDGDSDGDAASDDSPT